MPPMASTSYFSRIFGNSPVTPLQKHIASVIACVEQLIPYFEAVFKNDWDLAAKIQGKLASLEGEADDIKNKLRMHLPTSLFMPVDRRDILQVLDLQDLIANRAKDISGPYGIGNIIRAVCKGHGTCGKDHQYTKDQLKDQLNTM